MSATGSLSPSPDSLNADNVSSTSRDSCSGSHSDSFKSCVSSGYDSCNSAAAAGAVVEPCSSKAPSGTATANSSIEEQGSLETKAKKVSSDKGQKKVQMPPSENLDGESPPPLPSSPPPDLCPSDVPPFYVPPSGFPPPLFQKGQSISNATPLIQKLTEALSASAPYLANDTIDDELSLSSSFENFEEEEFTVQAPLSESAMLSTSTPNLSPMNASRHQTAGRHFQRLSLNSTISEEDSDNNDAAEMRGPSLTSRPKKAPPEFLPVARARKKSPRAKRETPPVPPPRVVNISGPTNVSLPASVDLTSSIYKPIQKPLIAANRSQSQSPDRMAFMDPFITEPSLNRDSSPFSRFLPNLASANYDKTKNFMRRSFKSPSLSSLRQSTRSLTSSALQTLRKSSRHLKSSLMASLNKAVSLDELDSPDSPRARANAIRISAPCVPKPVGTFAYCPPSSIENVTLKSTKNKKKFSSLNQISTTEKLELDSSYVFSSNSPTTFEPSSENGNFFQTQRKKKNRKISLPDFHRSMGSLGSPGGLSQSHAVIQPAISQDSLNNLHVFSETEINDITNSISRSLTTEVIRPKLTKPDKLSSNRPTSSIELGQPSKLPQEIESVSKNVEGSSGRIVEKLTESQDLEVDALCHQMKSNVPKSSVPLRKKKSSKPKPKKPDCKSNLKTESEKLPCMESSKIYLSSLPDEPSFPAPSTVPCKLAGLDSQNEEKHTFKRHPVKPKPLLGLPIDERQVQLQQQLLQCLKIRLDEYNTNGSVSPQPPFASLLSNDSTEISGSRHCGNDATAMLGSQSQNKSAQNRNEERLKHGKRLEEIVQFEQAQEEQEMISRGHAEEIDQNQDKLEKFDCEKLGNNFKQEENNEEGKVSHVLEGEETENLEAVEVESKEQSKLRELRVKQEGAGPAHVSTFAGTSKENTSIEQEDKFDENVAKKSKENIEEPNKDGVRPLNEKELLSHPKTSKAILKDTGESMRNEKLEDEKLKELKRLLEQKNLSLQLLHEKEEKELALRREKEELEKSQKLLEESLKQQELERVKLEASQNLRPAEDAKKLYLRKLLDEHQQEDSEWKTKMQHPLTHKGNKNNEKSIAEKLLEQPLNVKSPLGFESKTVAPHASNECEPQAKSDTKFEPIAPVKNIKQQLMYHIEQRKLQQKQFPKTILSSWKSTECKAAKESVPVKVSEEQSEEPSPSTWDDEEMGDILNTNISDFIGTELVGETEGYHDDEQASLLLLPPPANFCDSSFTDFDVVGKDVAAVDTLKGSDEVSSDSNSIAPLLNCATRPSLKTQKSKYSKRVTFGVSDTEINYYHEEKANDEEVVQETKTHPEFNAFALRRPKSKSRRSGSHTSPSEVKDLNSVPDSQVIYENIPPHESSDEIKPSPPPLPRKNSRSKNDQLPPPGAFQSSTAERGGKHRSSDREESSVSDADEVESFA